MADRALTTCDDCKQTDNHPKVHYGDDTYHHDCLPPRARRDVIESHPLAEKIIKACEKGKHGDDLFDHIVKLHQEG